MIVTLYTDSNGTHLHQIYSGLELLRREGLVQLKLRPGRRLTQDRPNRQFIALKLEAEGVSGTAVFDLQDSEELGLPNVLDQCDCYFKRSLTDKSYIGLTAESARKVKPAGFNYQVTVPAKRMLVKRIALEYLSRPFNPLKKKNHFHLHNLKEMWDANWKPGKSALLTVDELRPGYAGKFEYDVMFQCRLWDPDEMAPGNRADAEKVNNDRIRLVSALKDNLGSRFVGGLQPNAYARKVAPHLLVDSGGAARRRAYLELVKKSSLVISSAGLLGSNGWKLGEYIALGKAIISEPIKTELPGRFQDGVHYQSYQSVEECLEKVEAALAGPERIDSMSRSTKAYYFDHLEPRNLMFQHLGTLHNLLM